MGLLYIPCLNVDNPNLDTGLSIGVGVGATTSEDFPLSPGVEISHPEVPVTLTIIPVPPFISIGINFKFWSDLFGLGETRIEREKEQIQDVLTPIFKFLHEGYGFPLREGHALQFDSDAVESWMRKRPDLDFFRPSMYQEADILARAVFVDDTPTSGQRKRIVNQLLANAAINDWPTNATVLVWRALVESGSPDCRKDSGRWMRNPLAIEDIARYAALLHYMPLANFASAVSQHKFNDKQGRKIVTHWLQNPQLVAGIPQVLEIPPWAVSYRGPEDGGGQGGNPYETQQIADREPIQQLWQKVTFQRPWYPDLLYISKKGLIDQETKIDPPQKPPDYEQQPGNPPWPGDNVLEIPKQPDGPINWPQYPDCPPWNQRPQPGDPDPNPQPDPDEPPQKDGKCDPDCQVQIDYLIGRVEYIDNWLVLGIIPRLDNLEDWVRDLEHRVPGPLPPLPNPVPFPPWLPPEEIPTDPGDAPGVEPGGDNPCNFTEDDCCEIQKWIDPDKRCKEIRECERELECVQVPLCDENGGPWGGMAECWNGANMPSTGDTQGFMRGRSYPGSIGDALFAALKSSVSQNIGNQGQGQGGIGQTDPQSEQGRYIAASRAAGDFFMTAWKTGKAELQPYPALQIARAPWLFVDPANPLSDKLRLRQPKLRPDEIDPCDVEVI